MTSIAWNTDGLEKKLQECDDLIQKANFGRWSCVSVYYTHHVRGKGASVYITEQIKHASSQKLQ